MLLGYIRVSRDKQTTVLQEDAIHKAHCERIFTDKMGGMRDDRPEFLKMLDMARPGDVIVVWRLDRLGRSLRHLIETVTQMSERGIELHSLKENIDTTTPTGKLMFHIVGAMAEFERDIIRERTTAGLEAARARGRKGGGPRRQKPSSHATWHSRRTCTRQGKRVSPRLWSRQDSKVVPRSINMSWILKSKCDEKGPSHRYLVSRLFHSTTPVCYSDFLLLLAPNPIPLTSKPSRFSLKSLARSSFMLYTTSRNFQHILASVNERS